MFTFFYLTVNKLITDKILNIFYLIAEHSDFRKLSINKLNRIIWISNVNFSMPSWKYYGITQYLGKNYNFNTFLI